MANCAAGRTGFDARVTDQTAGYALIAIQGPEAEGILASLTDTPLGDLKYYAGQRASVAGRPVWLARTGYTGEDGFEIFCPPEDAELIWNTLASTGAPPAWYGLAARDTLRLKAGMPLYGNELLRRDAV